MNKIVKDNLNSSEKKSTPNSTILVVDDSPTSIKVLETFLSESGYVVFGTENSEEVLELAKEKKPNLILLDVMMPILNGYEVCSLLKKNHQTHKIPVIFMSALSELTDKVKGFKAGGVDYITKPFQIEELLMRVETHLTIVHMQNTLEKQNVLLEEMTKKLSLQAKQDGLTGVANRRCFDEILEQEWRRCNRSSLLLSLIMCDVDYFKKYNDGYGHIKGDECLKKISKAIQQIPRRGGDFVARYGGEEFAIILPNTDLNGAKYIGELIRKNVKELGIHHVFSGVSDRITISLGISTMIPRLELPSGNLLEEADQALYQAKEEGRDCVVTFNPNMENRK